MSLLTSASGCAVIGIPVYVGLRQGDVELEALGGVPAGMNLGPSVETAHGAVFGVWYQDPHPHPALRKGRVYRLHQRTNIQLCAYQHGPRVRSSQPPPTFLGDKVCLVE